MMFKQAWALVIIAGCSGCYSFPRPLTLSGIIVDDATGEPVGNAMFWLSRNTRKSYTEETDRYAEGTTSAKGTYKVTYVADSLTLYVKLPGYQHAQVGTSDGRSKHGIVLRLVREEIAPGSPPIPTTQRSP